MEANKDIIHMKKIFEDNVRINAGMLTVLEFFEKTKEGDIIMIDNLTRSGFIDNTCIGYYKQPHLKLGKIFFEGAEYIIEDIGIPIEFKEERFRQFYVTGENVDEFIARDYKKLQPHFTEFKRPIGVAHHNSILLSGKNEIDLRLRKYNSSFDAFLDSLK